jgi:hypothetical protein
MTNEKDTPSTLQSSVGRKNTTHCFDMYCILRNSSHIYYQSSDVTRVFHYPPCLISTTRWQTTPKSASISGFESTAVTSPDTEPNKNYLTWGLLHARVFFMIIQVASAGKWAALQPVVMVSRACCCQEDEKWGLRAKNRPRSGRFEKNERNSTIRKLPSHVRWRMSWYCTS